MRTSAISIHAPRTGSDLTYSTSPAIRKISIHAPRTGSDRARGTQVAEMTISIHAPRTGSDGACRWRLDSPAHFNPRSPHGERRRRNMAVRAYPEFQSTLPARGATVIGNAERKIQSAFQSTLPARGATTFPQSPRTSTINFNPRSPHGERLTRVQSAARADNFNPRSPHGERRWLMCETGRFTDFNPRSPHGERLAPTEMITQRGVFQSTLPARGATPS